MVGSGKLLAIPIVEEGNNRVVGGFCAAPEAVSGAELQALAQLKRLRTEAEAVKQQLRQEGNLDRDALTQQLEALRQEAAVWRAKREQATLEKHVALGHATLPVRSF
ncbi:MAG: hypothetical protein H7835_15540 [Magnetococcus sp. XQGC-1]